MGEDRVKSKRFQGVYFRESKTRRLRGRPDRSYCYCYRDAIGRLCWETVGWASNGISEEYTHQKRAERINLVRLGEDPSPHRKKKVTIGNAFESYIKAASVDGKHTIEDESRFAKHVRPVSRRQL